MAHSGTIIYMRNVPERPNNRALTAPLYCKNYDGTDGEVAFDFEWNGSSSELEYESESKIKSFFAKLILAPVNFVTRSIFPRHKHPIASCRHDWRCENAKSKDERLWADQEFKSDVGTTSGWFDKTIGYAGVRLGTHLGIGNNF